MKKTGFPFHDKSEIVEFHVLTLSSLLQVHWNRHPVLFHQKPARLFLQLLLRLLPPSDNRGSGLHLHLLVCQSLWSPWYASALRHHHWTVIAAAVGPHSVYVTHVILLLITLVPQPVVALGIDKILIVTELSNDILEI